MLARRLGTFAWPSATRTRHCTCSLTRIGRLAGTDRPTNPPTFLLGPALRYASGSSSTRWLSRQGRDPYSRASRLNQLKSRAAFKLLEIDDKHHLFRPGQTVVDLGYAPGSWSQVAISRVRPNGKGRGRVVGIDVIPAQPPRGVSTIQGDFLNASVRERVVEFVRDEQAGRPIEATTFARKEIEGEDGDGHDEEQAEREEKAESEQEGRVVDVVLSDMNEPWPLASGSWLNSVSNPWRRMMNTSGNGFKDHAGSMDLCLAALSFCRDTLKTGGTFLCKYYQGSEDKDFERRLKDMFERVHRIKPDSSRKESREAYFLALRKRDDTQKIVSSVDKEKYESLSA